ncbi:tryptophanyl-tRNA synthetase-like protein [Bisporella sp. PMI_857]|nr:tryptophanyl-tRNA synthetase-like protein [Bisporella sp. PMI_857]
MADLQPTAVAALATDAPTATSQKIDPWNVAGEVGVDGIVKAIDYLKLVEEFGTKKITKEDLERFEKVTGHRPHRFMRRGIVFSHRDLNLILDRHERGEPFFLYTGRGPSSDSMHIGHTVPFEFTKWLQDVFDVPLIIMLTDDEKYLFSEKRTIEEVQSYTVSNAKDIIAVGFDPKKTFIFSDLDFVGGAFYRNVVRMSKHMTLNVVRAVFGFDDSQNVGKFHFAAVQGATSFASSFPHIFGKDESKTNLIPSLIPCAIDQDPYFRVTRDVASRLHFSKPSLIHARFLDALQGPGSKMSASDDKSAIFMKDTPNQVKNKINRFAFSGGQETEELQREKGGDPDVDVAFQYLVFFLEDDDELERIRIAYRKGEMLTGELKKICIGLLQEYCTGFQQRRAAVTDATVENFFSQKALEYKGNPNPIKVAKEVDDAAATSTGGAGGLTKNQQKKLEKEKAVAAKKAAAAEAKKAAKSGS